MPQDPYKYFRVEARELLDQLGQGVLDLEKQGASPELVGRLLRLAHTLKGAARVVRRNDIGDLAHAMEDVLSPFRERTDALPEADVNRLFELLDRALAVVTALGEGEPRERAPEKLTALPREEPRLIPRADVSELDNLLEGISEVSVQLEGVAGTLRSVEHIQRLAELLNRQLSASSKTSEGDLRVRSLADELRSEVESLMRKLTRSVDTADRELRQVRERAEQLRLIPARTMFTALERTARDAAQSLGRSVRFEARGGEVRLDGQVIAFVQSALVQAVRNAVAHGIEPPHVRRRAQKAEQGLVSIEVKRHRGRISFVCADDGSGIDEDAVRAALKRRGAPVPSEATANALLALLFSGGVSTSREVTSVAGRGIGLDLIREVAENLGGELRAQSERGKGTQVELLVPASLGSLEALLVEANGQKAAFPLEAVHETLRIQPTDLTHSEKGSAVVHDGKVIPFAPLARALRRHETDDERARVWSAVLLAGRSGAAAVGVERLCGTANLVLRPLPALTPSDPIVLGASLDTQGNPQLVLDPEALVRALGQGLPQSVPARRKALPILVIDDSLTTRMLEQSILESAGYEVDVAASAEEGLARARARDYALFLVDVEMPGMTGFAFVETIRADPTLKNTPAILVTSRAAPEDKERGAAVGAQGYVVKSEFNQAELLERIRALVGDQ